MGRNCSRVMHTDLTLHANQANPNKLACMLTLSMQLVSSQARQLANQPASRCAQCLRVGSRSEDDHVQRKDVFFWRNPMRVYNT